jgi:plastocyanin
MPDRSLLVPLLAVAALVVAAVPAPAATHTINTWIAPMTAFTIDAEVGDTVVWTNVGPGHTVDHHPSLDGMDLDPVADGATICASAAGLVRIDSGGSATVNATQAGIFYYHCASAFPIHCNAGMRVRVNVADSVVGAPGEVEQIPWGRVKATYAR